MDERLCDSPRDFDTLSMCDQQGLHGLARVCVDSTRVVWRGVHVYGKVRNLKQFAPIDSARLRINNILRICERFIFNLALWIKILQNLIGVKKSYLLLFSFITVVYTLAVGCHVWSVYCQYRYIYGVTYIASHHTWLYQPTIVAHFESNYSPYYRN